MKFATVPTFLVCPPTHYGVDYIINPWMRPDEWAAHRTTWVAKAEAQWQALVVTLRTCGWGVAEIPGAPGLPDMVFAANHAFVLDGIALISHSATPERAGEEPLAADWFLAQGFDVRQSAIVQEGAGDILYDRWCDTIFVGGGEVDAPPFRSVPAAADLLHEIYGRRTLRLPMINPYFYHLDTCFCPLGKGRALYVPSAFGAEGTARLKEIYGAGLIAVDEGDAAHFACNAVVTEQEIVMPRVSAALTERLHGLGYITHQLELDAFILAGGASRCLTLRLTD